MDDDELYTPQQVRAAKRAAKALKELSDSGLCLLWHPSSGTVYAMHKEDYAEGNTSNALECGYIDDGGDF